MKILLLYENVGKKVIRRFIGNMAMVSFHNDINSVGHRNMWQRKHNDCIGGEIVIFVLEVR